MRIVHSLQGTIFLFFVALLLAVQGVFFQTIYSATQQQEKNQISSQLSTAQTVFKTQFESQSYYLAAFAETAAKDFGLKQAFQDDMRSFLVALNNHRQRIHADLAMAIGADGTVKAQLISERAGDGNAKVQRGPEQGQAFRFGDWLELPDESHLYSLQQAFFQLSLAPIKSGDQTIGWVGFGYRIDDHTAHSFSELTHMMTDFVIAENGGWRLLASSNAVANKAGQADENERIKALLGSTPPADLIQTHHIIGESNGAQLAVLMYGDRAHVLTEIRNHWWQLVLLAVVTLSVSLAGAYVIAARISRPVQQLVLQARQIAGGNYDVLVSVDAHGELKELADEFNNMQQAVVSRERVISHQAFHNELTGLPNRNHLIQTLESLLQHSATDLFQNFAVIKIAIRRLEEINSSLGHTVGDAVIVELGQRLRRVADKDSLFHIGGNEFIVLKMAVNEAYITQYIHMLLQVTEQEYRYQNILVFIEAQFGVVFYPDHDATAYGLLQKSATALQHAQKTRRHYKLYDDSLTRDSIEQLKLINDLKTAIDGNQLVLHYQPKLDLRTMRISQLEALVRWQHPERGLIPPDKFIAIAEHTGMIDDLTRWVVAEAARQHKQWRERGFHLNIAVNISAENLKHLQLYTDITEILKANTLDVTALSLEMTESAVLSDLEAALDVLNRFHQDGMALAIDDYGTGYSSLAQLKRLPVCELKIDRSFVRKLIQDTDDQIIVRSTIELAHNMGLQVVAEGIEDAETLQWLRDSGCDTGQGYHICRPAPADALLTWLLQSDYFQRDKARS